MTIGNTNGQYNRLSFGELGSQFGLTRTDVGLWQEMPAVSFYLERRDDGSASFLF